MSSLPRLSWWRLVTESGFAPVWSLAVLAVAALYVVGLRAATRAGRARVSAWRAVLFLAGLLVVTASVQSGIDTYAHTLLWMHMVEHLALIMVAPMLLALGCPLRVCCDALSPRWSARVREWFDRPAVAFLTHPIVGFLVYAAVLVLTHLTSFMDVMVSHLWLHTFEQVVYLVAGFWFFWPLLGNDPIRWRPHYLVRLGALLAGMVPDTVVGIVLLQGTHLVAPAMSARSRAWGPAPLVDQQTAGGIMWVFGDGLMMVAIAVVVLVYVVHHAQSPDAGAWLENVRRSTMAGHVRLTGADAQAFDSGSNLDEDADSLAAYNAMLRSLNQRSRSPDEQRRG